MFGKRKNASPVDEPRVLEALSKVIEPELHKDLVTLNMVKNIAIEGDRVAFTITLTTPACPLRDQIGHEARQAVLALPGVSQVDIQFDAHVPTDRRLMSRLNIDVRNAIAVASGKGGVGKSTVAVNLAVGLARMGAGVGLLDADVYGPNIPLMMGAQGQLSQRGGRIVPLETYGVKLISMGFLVKEDQPVIWRGPMIHNILRQFLGEVDWGRLDYLVVDLPPGTGDAALSLCQSMPLTGAVIVTTPQDVALADVVKGVAMFKQLDVPVLGVVENMSYFECGHCGERTYIFGRGGGERVARRMQIPYLGEVPIDPVVRAGGDEGRPVVADAPESPAGRALLRIAQDLAARVSVLHLTGPEQRQFVASPELRVL